MATLFQKAKQTALAGLFLASAGMIGYQVMRSDLPQLTQRDYTIEHFHTKGLEELTQSQDVDKARTWINKWVPLDKVDKTQSMPSDYIGQLKRQTQQIDHVLVNLSDKWSLLKTHKHVAEALIFNESLLDAKAKSKDKAYNLTQVTKIAYDQLKIDIKKYRKGFKYSWKQVQNDPIAALEAMSVILTKNLELSKGNIENSLAMYNGGPNQVLGAIKKARSIDIDKYKKHLMYRGRKESVPYAKKTRALSKEIQKLGFYDAVLDKHIEAVVYEYNATAEKQLKSGNYKTAIKILEDLDGIEGWLYHNTYKTWKARVNYNLGEAHKGMKQIEEARVAYKHAAGFGKNVYSNNAKFRLKQIGS